MAEKETVKRKAESTADEILHSDSKRNKEIEDQPYIVDQDNVNDQESINDFHLDLTQEYELQDSDGFEYECPSLSKEKTVDYTMPDTSGSKEQLVEPKSDTTSDEMIVSSSMISRDIDDKPQMSKIQSVLRDAETISSILPEADVNVLYNKVLKVRSQMNRVDIVTDDVLENGISSVDGEIGSSVSVSDSSSDGIFKDVADVLVQCPSADPNKVYDMLEQLEGDLNRVSSVLKQLHKDGSFISTSDTSNTTSSSTSSRSGPYSASALKDNPLNKDLKTLRKVLPDRDPAELYAYLEAHFDKGNRVQIVIDELTKSDSQESLPLEFKNSSEDTDHGKQPLTFADKFQIDLKELQEIFPDCDPDFLYEKLECSREDPMRVGKVAAELFEKKDYPKLKERLEKESKRENKERIHRMNFVMEEFLKKFPDPVTFFENTERQVNVNYQEHTLVYLKNTYPFVKDGFIRKVLTESKQHLAPAVKMIESQNFDTIGRSSKKLRATPREEVLDYPEDPEELFFQEVMFCQHKRRIQNYLADQKRQRDMKLDLARESGELLECGCCFDDECLFEEMGACADGHIFCNTCVSRSTEAAIGDGKTKFLCLTGTCEQQFPLKTLQAVLSSKTFSLALRKLQEEELRQADIPDLVTCPFCSFATVMGDPEDKIFKCLNPDCFKESCRFCKEPNHVPLRCNEVEKQGETNMRTFIETKMSEAMLRTCPRCKKRFYKESGCNKMTCSCGTTMCYICREANIDYNHFNDGKCQIDTDIFTMHKDEMLKAAEDARLEFLRDHPDQDQQLKYDPVKLLDKMKRRFDPGDDDDDDGYDEDDYDEGDDDYYDYDD